VVGRVVDGDEPGVVLSDAEGVRALTGYHHAV
jgi:hypothetical protein